jgi:hypothetical protein
MPPPIRILWEIDCDIGMNEIVMELNKGNTSFSREFPIEPSNVLDAAYYVKDELLERVQYECKGLSGTIVFKMRIRGRGATDSITRGTGLDVQVSLTPDPQTTHTADS